MVSLFINLALCQDLIQTLKNPFETTKVRLWKYVLLSIFVPMFLTIFIWLLSRQEYPTLYYKTKDLFDTPLKAPNNPVSEYYNLLLGLTLSIYMLVGFYSIIFAYRRLVRPGVSIEMRKLFLRKHAIYVIVFIIIWIFMLLFNYYQLFNPYNVLFSKNADI